MVHHLFAYKDSGVTWEIRADIELFSAMRPRVPSEKATLKLYGEAGPGRREAGNVLKGLHGTSSTAWPNHVPEARYPRRLLNQSFKN